MKNKLTPDEFLKLFGQLMAGLEDQYIPVMKSRAGMAFLEFKHGLRLDHFTTAADVEKAAREVFEPLNINQELLNAAACARDVWDSDSVSLDPDEVKGMLDAAIKRAERASGKTANPDASSPYETILLALTYFEDGAFGSAERTLRRFVDEYDTQEIEKETTPNGK